MPVRYVLATVACLLLSCEVAFPHSSPEARAMQNNTGHSVVGARVGPVDNSAAARTDNADIPGLSGTPNETPDIASSAPELRIGSGDLLEVSVYGAPEFNNVQTRVSGTGDVVLPFIGAQHVDGLTLAEAQKLISHKLVEGDYFHNPQVELFIREYASQGVSVLGEVQKPGVYPLQGARRLFDVISQAGGLTPRAGKIISIVHRGHPDAPQTLTLGDDVRGSVEGNSAVLPGDTIVVSKAGIVYVVGDVRLPGGFIMENGDITVLKALALAQGTNPTAALNKTRLIRSADGKRQETPLALKQVLSNKAEDLTLRSGDILFVPSSAAKSAARRSIDAIIQTATGVAIYGRY